MHLKKIRSFLFYRARISPCPSFLSVTSQFKTWIRFETGGGMEEGGIFVCFPFVWKSFEKCQKWNETRLKMYKSWVEGVEAAAAAAASFTKINLFSFSLELWLWRFCPSCIFRSNCIREFDAFGWLLLFFYITHTNASTSRAESDFRSTFWKSRSARGKGKHGLSFSCLLNFNEGKNRRHAPANLFSGWKCLFTYFSRGGWKNLF